jgi:hypothetical protein
LIKQNHVVHLLLLLSLAPFLHIKPQQIRTRKNTTPAMSLTPNHQYQNSLTKSSLFFSYAITPTKENHSRLKTLNNKKKRSLRFVVPSSSACHPRILLALKTEEEPSPSLVPTNKNPQINE